MKTQMTKPVAGKATYSAEYKQQAKLGGQVEYREVARHRVAANAFIAAPR